MKVKSQRVNWSLPSSSGGIGKRERNRRLTSLGLSFRDPDDVQRRALAIVARFRAWSGHRRCVVSGLRTGAMMDYEGELYRVVVQWAHLKTRGSWGADFGNSLSLVDLWHRQQEVDGQFFEKRHMDERQLAHDHAVAFFREYPNDARWMVEHCQDGDVVALATEALIAIPSARSTP